MKRAPRARLPTRSRRRVGDVVDRGAPIALSGYSGLDALVAFPWSVPHVHFNVWLDGDSVDPFATGDETPLWRGGNEPEPGVAGAEAVPPSFTRWSEAALGAALAACTKPAQRDALVREPDPGRRAMGLLFQRNYYPSRFAARPPVYAEAHARAPWLSLPFRAGDFVGIVFPS